MQNKTKKQILIILLILLAIGSLTYAILLYEQNKEDIIITLADIARELTLPYHVAQMSLRDPVNELPVPIYGVSLVEIDDTWGAARSEGRTHEGTDIFANRGTPVFSATEGYIRRLNFGSRGGRNVMVVGPGGINYYYAHFERIADGIEHGTYVTPDTVLGFVGNSGNAESAPPHLHLGIYTEPGNWDAVINPYPLLVDRW